MRLLNIIIDLQCFIIKLFVLNFVADNLAMLYIFMAHAY